MDTTTDLLSAQQLCSATGMSYRQLDYWCKNGVFGEKLASPGSGYGRRFERDAIPIAETLVRLGALRPGLKDIQISADVKAQVANAVRRSELSSGWVLIHANGIDVVSTMVNVEDVFIAVRFGR